MRIRIDLTETDLQELMSGDSFDWTYTSDTGESVDVHLYNSTLEDEEVDCLHNYNDNICTTCGAVKEGE